MVVSYITLGDGNGDWAYNTCREIIDRNEKGAFAHMALEEMFRCLEMGVRWPDYMNSLITLGVERQHKMTQDPWILAYCCAVHLDRIDLIERYKPSRGIFSFPDKWAFRRALLGQRNAYRFWRFITQDWLMPDFVYVFYGYMDLAYLKTRS